MSSPYDAISELYDPWSRSVVEDVAFYVEESVEAGSPVVELGVGTGRIAIPVASEGVSVIGVDNSPGMLEVCRQHAELAGVAARIDLRLGDLREPPVEERVRLVTCPFRAFLHLMSEQERLDALRAARELLVAGGRLIFDVFAPSREDIEQTNGRWIEREPGIWERAVWDEPGRTLTLSVHDEEGDGSTMQLAWTTPEDWRRLLGRAGFEVAALYGWFDRRPYRGGEDAVWVARRV